MHSEGLTFQPVLNNTSPSVQKENCDEGQKQDLTPVSSMDDAQDIQEMVIESQQSFFDESQNLGIVTDEEDIITNFAKRIMCTDAFSPRKKKITNVGNSDCGINETYRGFIQNK